MSSPDVAEPPLTLELSDSSNSTHQDDSIDWREKACELLEKQLEQLVTTNTCLAEKSTALAVCLLEVLSDVTTLSALQRENDMTDKEWLHKQLAHVIQLTSQRKPESSDASSQSVDQTTTTKLSPSMENSDCHLGRLKRALNMDVERKPKQRKTRHTFKSEPQVHYEDTSSRTESDGTDEEVVDSETIRAAFRLFAQHIGPSLKREYRAQFGCPPSQNWLADQLLSRWDALSPLDRRTWNKRA